MNEQPLTDDTVLYRYVSKIIAVVGIKREVFVSCPCKRAMVKDHVPAIGSTAAVAVTGSASHSEPHIADDGIGGS